METGNNSDGNSGRSHGGGDQNPSGRGNDAQSTTGDSGANAGTQAHGTSREYSNEDQDSKRTQDDGGGGDTLNNDDDTSRAPESGTV